MALPEPPPNVPRIVEVQNPGTGHYVVFVRMPAQRVAMFPDKPWGTSIDAIGLAKQDSDRFAGYTLVDIEPLKGVPDLYWIFQKLDGPTWTTKSKGQDSLVPAKFRRQVVTTQTKQEVFPDTEPSELVGNLESSVVQQEVDTGKAVKIDTEEVIDENEEPLIGQIAYEQRQVADTSEQLVPEGTEATTGLYIISDRVSPLGNGKSIKETVSVGSWVEHTKAEWNNDLMGHVVGTEQFVSPSEALSPLPFTSYQIVNEDRSLKVTEIIPTEALNNYVLSYPTKISLDLPRVLKTLAVVWNEGYDLGQNDNSFNFFISGDSFTASADNSDTDNSSISLSPEVLVEWQDYSSNNLFATAYLFYLPAPATKTQIIDRLNEIIGGGADVELWPVFRTESHTIVTLGQSASVRVRTSASLSRTVDNGVVTGFRNQFSTGDDISKNLSNGTIQIPPCIHPEITIIGETFRRETITADAESPIYLSDGTSITPTHTREIEIRAGVSPTVLPATSPSSVPTSGLYLVDARVQPYEYGYVKVYAEVFDASDLDTDE
jgi:hypothetical protein